MHVHYIKDEYSGHYRVWQSQMPGDVFDTYSINLFELLLLDFVKRMPSVFVADFPDDDAGNLVCPKCIEEQQSVMRVTKKGMKRRSYMQDNGVKY